MSARGIVALLAAIALSAPSIASIELGQRAVAHSASSARGSPGTGSAHGVDLSWMGRPWAVTNGPMAGVARGSPKNVSLDARGWLHLRIVHRGATTTAAELFTRQRLGFGTYQWQIEGGVDRMDPSTVLGLFPYGPDAGVGTDGTNELDVEFSRWNRTLCGGRCNGDFTFYPATSYRRLGPTERDFHLNLHRGDLVTARLIWSPATVTGIIMSGTVPVDRTMHVLESRTFEPKDPGERIPQVRLPVGINLWCYEKVPPADQSVIIRSFSFRGEPS